MLQEAGLLQRKANPNRKGSGFVQPLAVHEHWHIDVSHLNIGGTFYYLAPLLNQAEVRLEAGQPPHALNQQGPKAAVAMFVDVALKASSAGAVFAGG